MAQKDNLVQKVLETPENFSPTDELRKLAMQNVLRIINAGRKTKVRVEDSSENPLSMKRIGQDWKLEYSFVYSVLTDENGNALKKSRTRPNSSKIGVQVKSASDLKDFVKSKL